MGREPAGGPNTGVQASAGSSMGAGAPDPSWVRRSLQGRAHLEPPGWGGCPLSPELHLVFRSLCLTILLQSSNAVRAREPPPRGLRPENPKEKTHQNDSKRRGLGVCDDTIRQ